MTELRACDCGAGSVVMTYERVNGIRYCAWAECTWCGRRGPRCGGDTSDAALSAAIAGWNERPVEDALRVVLDKARGMIDNACREVCAHEDCTLCSVYHRRCELLTAIDAALEVNNG